MRKSMILTFDFRKKWNVLIIIWDVMCILDLAVFARFKLPLTLRSKVLTSFENPQINLGFCSLNCIFAL